MGVLALPATAIRRVNAGLIVGNPVGGNNTRAKALTSAELKAIIEASGISYLPLSGGTLTGALSIGENALTCGAITTSGNLAIRNGLTAMQAEVFGTYTSATSFESLCLKATATAMQIGSAIGSAGGTNRPVQLGHFDAAGTFTSGLSIATTGAVTIGTTISLTSSTGTVQVPTTGAIRWASTRTVLTSSADGMLIWSTSTNSSRVRFDFTTANLLVLTDNAGTTPIALTCGAISSSSDLSFIPSASRTLSTNGQFSIEMTSNTAGNLVYRGSDGTTRRMALTFS